MRTGDGRERILDEAEHLFREHGYQAVSLNDVARTVGIRKPSIYHHFAGGKEELFVAVQTRMFERLGDDLSRILDVPDRTLHEQLAIATRWFLSHPPMFLLTMIHHDMPALSPEHRTLLTERSYGVVMAPLVRVVGDAIERGEARPIDPHVCAGAYLAVLEGNIIAARSEFGPEAIATMMEQSIDLILRGALLEPDGR